MQGSKACVRGRSAAQFARYALPVDAYMQVASSTLSMLEASSCRTTLSWSASCGQQSLRASERAGCSRS